MAFVRRTGKSRYKEYPNTAVVIAKGDACEFNEGGFVQVAATSEAIVGIATRDSAVSTTAVLDIVDKGSEWLMPIEAGTMVATEIGEEADLNSPDGITLTESNNDVLITGWDTVSTDKCYGIFKILAFGETTAAGS